MEPSLIVSLLCLGLGGVLLSSFLALFRSTYKFSSWLFVIANLLNFFASSLFLLFFANGRLMLLQFNWLFDFTPTLYFLPAIFLAVISLVSGLVGIYGVQYLESYEKTYNKYATQFLIGLFVFGMQAVLFANNAFSFIFFWEVMSVSSFFLVLADKSKESFSAAFLYFIMTHLGASAILGGFLILGNGNLLFSLSDIKAASELLSPTMLATAFGLFLFGFGSKAGLVPLHVWLPEAHPQAPSNVSALMSGLMLKVAIYGFLVVMLGFVSLPNWAGLVVIILGLLSGFIGALYAALESDMKKALAYSSIENIGIIFSMLGLAIYLNNNYSNPELTGFASSLVVFAIIHAICHAFFKTALFLSSGVAISRVHSRSLEVMGGFAKAMPIFSAAFLLAILSSLPLPPFGTFYGEWGMIHVLVTILGNLAGETNLMPVLVLALSFIGLIGGLAIFAMIKMFAISMLGLSRNKHGEIKSETGDNLMIAPIFILGLGVVSVGFFAKNLIAYLSQNLQNTQTTGEIFGSDIQSSFIFLVVGGSLLFAYLVNLFFAKEKGERSYHTWDCGQPIDASMEYTSSAFVAPIRFFFANIIGRTRSVTSEPIVATNPWIRQYSFYLRIHPAMKEAIYQPISNAMLLFAERLKVIQGGRIQYYLLLLLVTLIIALSFAI